MDDFGLSQHQQQLIRATLQKHPRITEAKIYGSRAMGRERPNSDVDIALWGDIDATELSRLRGELDELPLPYMFDLTLFEDVRHQPLRDHIERVGRLFFRKG